MIPNQENNFEDLDKQFNRVMKIVYVIASIVIIAYAALFIWIFCFKADATPINNTPNTHPTHQGYINDPVPMDTINREPIKMECGFKH